MKEFVGADQLVNIDFKRASRAFCKYRSSEFGRNRALKQTCLYLSSSLKRNKCTVVAYK